MITPTHLGSRSWLLAVPVTALAAIALSVSAIYAWNLSGPYEHRLSYRRSAVVIGSTLILVVAAAAAWRCVSSNRQQPRSNLSLSP